MRNLFETLHKSVGDKMQDVRFWPNYGEFEVVIGAILTQNTKWSKVERSLQNLKDNDILSPQDFLDCDNLNDLIKPSGFYNTKSKYIKNICKNLISDFGDFKNFKDNVNRDWLLNQKGIGLESADSILCYACCKDEFVVDSYTIRILSHIGYEELDYEMAKEQILINLDVDKSINLIDDISNLAQLYAYYHGLFVEFGKEFLIGKKIKPDGLEILSKIVL